MGNLTKKVKKKKSRKTKAKFVSLVSIAAASAFMYAASAFFLRRLFNASTLLPSAGVAKDNVLFGVGDLMVLKFDMALRIMGEKDLLYAEYARELALLVLFIAATYMIGKSALDRLGLLLFVGGLFGVLYYGFLYAFLRWPTSLLARDILALLPTPIIVPVYMPLLLSGLVIIGGFFLVFKKK